MTDRPLDSIQNWIVYMEKFTADKEKELEIMTPYQRRLHEINKLRLAKVKRDMASLPARQEKADQLVGKTGATLNEVLAALDLKTLPGNYGQKYIILDNQVAFKGDAKQVWDWLHDTKLL